MAQDPKEPDADKTPSTGVMLPDAIIQRIEKAIAPFSLHFSDLDRSMVHEFIRDMVTDMTSSANRTGMLHQIFEDQSVYFDASKPPGTQWWDLKGLAMEECAKLFDVPLDRSPTIRFNDCRRRLVGHISKEFVDEIETKFRLDISRITNVHTRDNLKGILKSGAQVLCDAVLSGAGETRFLELYESQKSVLMAQAYPRETKVFAVSALKEIALSLGIRITEEHELEAHLHELVMDIERLEARQRAMDIKADIPALKKSVSTLDPQQISDADESILFAKIRALDPSVMSPPRIERWGKVIVERGYLEDGEVKRIADGIMSNFNVNVSVSDAWLQQFARYMQNQLDAFDPQVHSIIPFIDSHVNDKIQSHREQITMIMESAGNGTMTPEVAAENQKAFAIFEQRLNAWRDEAKYKILGACLKEKFTAAISKALEMVNSRRDNRTHETTASHEAINRIAISLHDLSEAFDERYEPGKYIMSHMNSERYLKSHGTARDIFNDALAYACAEMGVHCPDKLKTALRTQYQGKLQDTSDKQKG